MVASQGELDAYNLLLTPRWMLLVPRSQRMYGGVDVNAMGFIGCLLVRGPDARRTMETSTPLGILRGVTFPRHQEDGEGAVNSL